jgi:NAD(P)-dependent dehydrogenase (short-subunit alcohol dehydrogenase family)
MLTPKTILITGGTSGIGRQTALHLAAEGHRVFAASRKPPAEAMPGVTYLALNLQAPETIQQCIASVLDQAGQIDVLINNAGYVGPAGASEEVSMADVRAVFETNFFGAVQMVNAVLPAMRQRRRGLIINISSAAGQIASPPFVSFYVASKHALEGYSKALAADLRPLGIHVAVIEPGFFVSNVHNTFNHPTNPQDVYDQERQHGMAVNGFCIRHGRDPQQVAACISQLVNGTPRRLHYPVGLDVNYIFALRKLLPDRLFEALQRWLLVGGQPIQLDDDDATIRRKLGIRRYLLDSRLADRLWNVSWGLLAFFGVAGVWLGSKAFWKNKKHD